MRPRPQTTVKRRLRVTTAFEILSCVSILSCVVHQWDRTWVVFVVSYFFIFTKWLHQKFHPVEQRLRCTPWFSPAPPSESTWWSHLFNLTEFWFEKTILHQSWGGDLGCKLQRQYWLWHALQERTVWQVRSFEWYEITWVPKLGSHGATLSPRANSKFKFWNLVELWIQELQANYIATRFLCAALFV
jgi:hypothetical protein